MLFLLSVLQERLLLNAQLQFSGEFSCPSFLPSVLPVLANFEETTLQKQRPRETPATEAVQRWLEACRKKNSFDYQWPLCRSPSWLGDLCTTPSSLVSIAMVVQPLSSLTSNCKNDIYELYACQILSGYQSQKTLAGSVRSSSAFANNVTYINVSFQMLRCWMKKLVEVKLEML